jgi:phytanoyl-CoA hydroxylase
MPRPDANSEENGRMLDETQVRQYREQGYVVCPEFLNSAEVAGLLEEMRQVTAGATLGQHDSKRLEMEPKQRPEGTVVRRIYEPCTHYQGFRALSCEAKLLDAVESLIGGNIVFHYSKINMKAQSIGSVVEWHQDLSYYPLTNRDSMAVLFYLDDASETNGCLRVIPGLHRGPLLNHSRDGLFQGRVVEQVDESKAVALEAPAGSAIFMDAMTPHASSPNNSPFPRRTLILSYRAADAFPIYLGEFSPEHEAHVRLVRGDWSETARFTMDSFPIPRYPQKTRSLYELQEISHQLAGQ